MAGSYKHVTNDDGSFMGVELLDDVGDAHEALDQMHFMIGWLAKVVSSAWKSRFPTPKGAIAVAEEAWYLRISAPTELPRVDQEPPSVDGLLQEAFDRRDAAKRHEAAARQSEEKWKGKLQAISNAIGNLDALLKVERQIARVQPGPLEIAEPLESLQQRRQIYIAAMKLHGLEPQEKSLQELEQLESQYITREKFDLKMLEVRRAYDSSLEDAKRRQEHQVQQLNVRIGELVREGEKLRRNLNDFEQKDANTTDNVEMEKRKLGALRLVFEQLVDDVRGFDGPLAETVRRRCRRVLDRRVGKWNARHLVLELASSTLIYRADQDDGGVGPEFRKNVEQVLSKALGRPLFGESEVLDAIRALAYRVQEADRNPGSGA